MNAARLVVEKVQPETLPKLTHVLQAGARALEQKGAPLWPLAGLEPEALSKDYPQSEMYLGVYNHEAVAGMILLEEDPIFWPDAQTDEALFIHKLAVIPSVQGLGFATQMLAFALARAKACNKRYLRLDCDARRPKLCRFYATRGFTCVGRRSIGTFDTAFYERGVQA